MKQEVRKYKMSDAKLVHLAENLKKVAVRDLENLEESGVSVNSLNELQSAIFSFSQKPTDEELCNDLISSFKDKELEKVLVNVIRSQIDPSSTTQQIKTASFLKGYGINYPAKHTNNNYYKQSERALQFQTDKKLEELSLDGITEEMLEKLGTKNQVNLNEFINNGDIRLRDIAVSDRIACGNTLYAMMITLSAKGKQYWLDLSEKRYNDYISTEKYINNWQCTDGNIGAFKLVNLSVTAATDATVFTLTNNGSVPLQFFFSNLHFDVNAACSVILAPGNSQTYTAAALGYNDSNCKTRLYLFNNNSLPANYLVEWV